MYYTVIIQINKHIENKVEFIINKVANTFTYHTAFELCQGGCVYPEPTLLSQIGFTYHCKIKTNKSTGLSKSYTVDINNLSIINIVNTIALELETNKIGLLHIFNTILTIYNNRADNGFPRIISCIG